MMGTSLLIHILICTCASALQLTVPNWKITLDDANGLLQSLQTNNDQSFDFLPAAFYDERSGAGHYHTGDITFRWRTAGQSAWQNADSAASRSTHPQSSAKSNILLHQDLGNVFPDAARYLNISRDWVSVEDDLVLSATIANVDSSTDVELGAFGFPIEIHNIFSKYTTEQTTKMCSFADPYLGQDAGYIQVTRIAGTGPHMVITPYGNSSKVEAWRFLTEDTGTDLHYQSVPYEGNYELQMLSRAYAEQEWKSASPWNNATSTTLRPGQSVSFAIRFSPTQQLYDIENVVASKGQPVAVGIPGYVIPRDYLAQLFLQSTSPISSISTEPANALTFTSFQAQNASWAGYTVTPSGDSFGRVRARVNYANGQEQTVHYVVTNPSSSAVAGLGDFLSTKQWYTDASDVFHRAPAVMSYDHSASALVLEDERVWIAGISDDAGSGPFEASAVKNWALPNAGEIAKLETMANTSVAEWLTVPSGEDKYGVRRSLFFYDPSAVPGYKYQITSGWDKPSSYQLWRAYNYVHVSALYYSLYRAERAAPGILQQRNGSYYLSQAAQTVIFGVGNYVNGTPHTAFADAGLMCETIWPMMLTDLKAEGMQSTADQFEGLMRAREQHWSSIAEPYGSEQPWDSTGEEGVYAWAKYFGDKTLQQKTIERIRGYTPTVAHWGWNGNARRYWDFTTAGKLSQIERMIHHYGSALNALPVLDAYKYSADPSSPQALYDLRIAYAGNMAPLSNIANDGFGSVAFHSYPENLFWDAYSGDYGLGFTGHILGATTYLVQHPSFGWISMGGIVSQQGSSVTVTTKDTVRRSIYIADMGLSVKLDGGIIQSFTYDSAAHSLGLSLTSAMDVSQKQTVLFWESTLGKSVRLVSGGVGQKYNGTLVNLPSTVQFSL